MAIKDASNCGDIIMQCRVRGRKRAYKRADVVPLPIGRDRHGHVAAEHHLRRQYGRAAYGGQHWSDRSIQAHQSQGALRERVCGRKGDQVYKIASKDNPADALTKPSSHEAIETLMKAAGMKELDRRPAQGG